MALCATVQPDRSPIFIVGTGRSGTTLLRLMLCAHPRIYITHEASFYMWEALYSAKAPRREFLDHYFQTFSFRWLRVDPRRVLDGLPDPLPREHIGAAYAAVMREKAAQYGRVRFGDKTPAHTDRVHRIFEDFPEAKVVHIYRDPRSTCSSLARMPWASRSLYANSAFFYETQRRRTLKFRDRILTVKMEELLAAPRATMQSILDFVGEPWDEAVLDHANHLPARDDMPPLPWLESATRDRALPPPPWTGLTPVEVRMIERRNRRLMEELGYAPAPLEAEPGRLAVWWRNVREVPEALRFIGLYAKIGLRMRDPKHLNSAETNALFRGLNPPSWSRYPGFEIPQPPPLPALPPPAAP